VICRPTNVAVSDYHPLPSTLSVLELEALAEEAAAAAAAARNRPLLPFLGGASAGGGGGAGDASFDGNGNGRSSNGSSNGNGSAASSRNGSNNHHAATVAVNGHAGQSLTDLTLWPTLLDASPRSSIDYDSFAVIPPESPALSPGDAAAVQGAAAGYGKAQWTPPARPLNPLSGFTNNGSSNGNGSSSNGSSISRTNGVLLPSGLDLADDPSNSGWGPPTGTSSSFDSDDRVGGPGLDGGQLGLFAEWGRMLVPGAGGGPRDRIRGTMAFIPTVRGGGCLRGMGWSLGFGARGFGVAGGEGLVAQRFFFPLER